MTHANSIGFEKHLRSLKAQKLLDRAGGKTEIREANKRAKQMACLLSESCC